MLKPIGARSNIYESIRSPNSFVSSITNTANNRRLNRLSSASTSKLADASGMHNPDETRRLLIQSSDNQLDKSYLKSAATGDFVSDHDFASIARNCDNPHDKASRRRYPNDDHQQLLHTTTDYTTNNLDLCDRSNNLYSEILLTTHPTTPVPLEQTTQLVDHYRVPSTTAQANSTPTDTTAIYATTSSALNDEVNHLIEAKRKRTLLLLRAKEAPRASVELTSPIDDVLRRQMQLNSLALAPLDHQRTIGACSPIVSEYENISITEMQRGLNEDHLAQTTKQTSSPHPIEAEHDGANIEHHHDNPDTSGEATSLVSPSESQNLNTLSLTSDLLGDLSQEESSLVQQLSQG